MDIDFSLRPGEGFPVENLHGLLASGPVFWSDALGGWVISSHAAIKEVLSDLSRFTSVGTPVENALGPDGMLLNDTLLHNRMRQVWTKSLSKSVMLARTHELESIAADELSAARRRLETGETIDLVPFIQQFALRFVSSLFAVPIERVDVIQRWAQLSADAPVLEVADDGVRAAHAAAKQDVYCLVHEAIADRKARFQRGELPEDLVSLMTAAEGVGGITPSHVADNLFNLIIGSDTTERWIGNIIVRLLTDPQVLQSLRDDAGLMESMIQEVMRTDTVVQIIMRRVKPEGAALAGQALNGGDHMYLMLGAANRDAAEHEHPDLFDIRRPIKPNIGFGFGFHHCLGINLARQEAAAFIKMLLDLLPALQLVECDYGTTWALWGPRHLRVRKLTAAH